MIIRAQISIAADSLLPRDRLVMTPHFEVSGGALPGIDFDALANDLATGIGNWMVTANSREVNVKIYDAQGSKPVIPEADVTKNTNLAPASAVMREAALCLSYFAGANRARRRGRLYVPVNAFVSAGGSLNLGLRPTLASQQKVADLVPIFAGLGGIDCDWVVYSRQDNTARKITDWWVDNEWDIVRTRGLRPSSRLAGTTSG